MLLFQGVFVAVTAVNMLGLSPQDKMDGFVPAHFLGWYIKVAAVVPLHHHHHLLTLTLHLLLLQ